MIDRNKVDSPEGGLAVTIMTNIQMRQPYCSNLQYLWLIMVTTVQTPLAHNVNRPSDMKLSTLMLSWSAMLGYYPGDWGSTGTRLDYDLLDPG